MPYIEDAAYKARGQKIKALEAENARLREERDALKEALRAIEQSSTTDEWHDAWDKARAALKETAEMEGE